MMSDHTATVVLAVADLLAGLWADACAGTGSRSAATAVAELTPVLLARSKVGTQRVALRVGVLVGLGGGGLVAELVLTGVILTPAALSARGPNRAGREKGDSEKRAEPYVLHLYVLQWRRIGCA